MYNLFRLCGCVGISAMETALCTNMLHGRPFGGVAILVRDAYSERINIHKCAERFIGKYYILSKVYVR